MENTASITKRTRRVEILKGEILKALERVERKYRYPLGSIKKANVMDVVQFLPSDKIFQPSDFQMAILGLEHEGKIVVLRKGVFDQLYRKEWIG